MNKKLLWTLEIFIWIFIIFIGGFFLVIKNKIEDDKKNTYYMLVNDAGGLIKGSPVRIMGINIGYIEDVKIFDNKVFVSFHITKKDVQIPQKTVADIEFYGLGGSTSLELMQDYSLINSDREFILPVNSYRVKDLWDGQALVANVLIDIYGGIGRNIQRANLLEKKYLLKQSPLVKSISEEIYKYNSVQNVYIHKLTDSTKEYVNANKSIEQFKVTESEN